MKFLNHQEAENQWQLYQQLESISDDVPNPDRTRFWWMFGLGWTWRKFIALLIAELEAEDRVEEYLDRCWQLDEFGKGENPAANTLQRLWVLMD